jgi:plastocyanin
MGTFLMLGLIVGSSYTAKSYAYEEIEVSNGGTITGTVKFAGDAPATKMLNINKDQEACGHEKKPSDVLIICKDTNAIKNVVVSIENIEKGKKFNHPSSNPTIDQKGCVFIPHVIAVPTNSTIDILNSDDVMHNVHAYAMKNSPFNEGVTGGGKLPKTFEFKEVVPLKCDVHKWMTAFIVVKDNPYYAVTDESGNFKIDNVPPGTYKLQAWQEKLGKKVSDVTVEAGKEVKADFELEKRKRRKR